MADAFLTHILAELSKKHTLQAAWVPFSLTIPPATGTDVAPASYTVPNKWPLVILRGAYASNRAYDGRLIRLVQFETDQVKFLVRPGYLESLFGNVAFGSGIDVAQPLYLAPNETVRLKVRRDNPVDPAELYPGINVPSQLDITLHGVFLLPQT
jgi:hypothetical protein